MIHESGVEMQVHDFSCKPRTKDSYPIHTDHCKNVTELQWIRSVKAIGKVPDLERTT